MAKKGIEITSSSLRDFAAKLREKYGEEAVAKLAVREIRRMKNKNVAIVGMRSEYEEAYFRSKLKHFAIIAISAPERLRFERIKKRGRRDDPKTLREFREIEKKEERGFSKTPNKRGMSRVLANADYVVLNTGTVEQLRKDLLGLLKRLEANG